MRPAVALLPLLAVSLLSASASAGGEPIGLSATCRAEPGSGRQVCRVKITAPAGERLAWADVLVRRTPAEVRPLRARVAALLDAKGNGADAVFGLVANHAAAPGVVSVQGRAVVCGAERCRPVTSELEIPVAHP